MPGQKIYENLEERKENPLVPTGEEDRDLGSTKGWIKDVKEKRKTGYTVREVKLKALL